MSNFDEYENNNNELSSLHLNGENIKIVLKKFVTEKF